ncbi:MAG: hypothetical protein M3444_07750 [Acidobacteriota bacterium]|nr:hypothetical protein [Acidobacteriota bacterium]MDQ5836693.1 hypothetical protein [Acidobacteriota bacterium]
MRETEHFINEGYGWACKRCLGARGATQGTPVASVPPAATSDAESSSDADSSSRAHAPAGSSSDALADLASSSRASALPRFFREGEAEEREPRLSADALARWRDDSRRALLCPRCGVEEEIEG